VLIDPRPGGATSGTMKVTMTPATATAIFESWPVVERAFRENVPGNVGHHTYDSEVSS
jgi:transcription initiation factor TFIIH subunit 1